MLILKRDCTFVFAVLLSLARGFGVFAALSSTVVVLVLSVVVTRCRAARGVAVGTVLWLVIVGPSTRHIKLVESIVANCLSYYVKLGDDEWRREWRKGPSKMRMQRE